MFSALSLSLSSVPRGVIQNGARVRSQALFPVIRPLPVSPVGSRTSAIRLVNFTPVTLNHVINVNQGFPSTNTFPHRRTQTHPRAYIQWPSNKHKSTHTQNKRRTTSQPNFPLIVYITTSLLCSEFRGIHTLLTAQNILSRCVCITVSHTHTQTGLLEGEAS